MTSSKCFVETSWIGCHGFFRFSPDGQYLALGNDDGSVDFYGIRAEARLSRAGICKGIPSYVTQLDWSADSTMIKAMASLFCMHFIRKLSP